MPLVAVAQELRSRNTRPEILFIGTGEEWEQKIAKSYNLRYQKVAAGKFRRYWSIKNLGDPFLVIAGFIHAIFKIRSFKPDVVVMAGGYVGVPVAWAAKLLRRPVIVHQQDLKPGLANKLVRKIATQITVTFQESLKYFPSGKTHWIGNPIRKEVFMGDRKRAIEEFRLASDVLTVLILGGGTGALELNKIIVAKVSDLTKQAQIIHVTGLGKGGEVPSGADNRYHAFEFLTTNLKDAYRVADIVITRAGLSTLSELAALSKVIIIVPMPKTHQEGNAAFYKDKGAAMVIQQENLDEQLVEKVTKLLGNNDACAKLRDGISAMVKPDAREKMADLIEKFAKDGQN